jgi:hypothetical protein
MGVDRLNAYLQEQSTQTGTLYLNGLVTNITDVSTATEIQKVPDDTSRSMV